MLSQSIIDVLEDNGIDISEFAPGAYDLEFYSDLGEDFCFTVNADNSPEFITAFCEFASDFDPDDHAAMWIENRGKNGTPDSIRALIDDADEIKEFLENMGIALNKYYYMKEV